MQTNVIVGVWFIYYRYAGNLLERACWGKSPCGM